MGIDGYTFCAVLVFCTVTILFLVGVFSPFLNKLQSDDFEKNCFEKFGEYSENFVETCFTTLGSFCANHSKFVLLTGKKNYYKNSEGDRNEEKLVIKYIILIT